MLRPTAVRFALLLSIGVLGAGVLAAGVLAARAGAVSATPPRIVAKPNNAMVNTKIKLTGTGFGAKKTFTVSECGTAHWIAPQDPCDRNNAITVTTDAHGGFTRLFRLELCPRTKTGSGPVTEETCYIGMPKINGVDTLALVGAVRVTVTYP